VSVVAVKQWNFSLYTNELLIIIIHWCRLFGTKINKELLSSDTWMEKFAEKSGILLLEIYRNPVLMVRVY